MHLLIFFSPLLTLFYALIDVKVLEQYQIYGDGILGTYGNNRPNVRDVIKVQYIFMALLDMYNRSLALDYCSMLRKGRDLIELSEIYFFLIIVFQCPIITHQVPLMMKFCNKHN